MTPGHSACCYLCHFLVQIVRKDLEMSSFLTVLRNMDIEVMAYFSQYYLKIPNISVTILNRLWQGKEPIYFP